MSIAILATGDEIVQGDTLNTNGHAIAHALNSENLNLGLQLSCSDNEEDLLRCLQFLGQHHDTIILIGGLGPTSDDRTRFAFARYIGESLVEFSSALDHIEARLHRSLLKLNAGNRQQALFPVAATLLPNPQGTAMGCIGEWHNKTFVLLPGPPRECLPMFNNHVLPLLQQKRQYHRPLLKWRLFGVSEGEISERLDKALTVVECETGYRLEMPYLEFKVRCDDSKIERVREIIEPLVSPHIIAPPEQKASERLSWLIGELQQPIVIIDEVTGGLLQMLIQHPNNHEYLHFFETEGNSMHFHLSGLDAYWSAAPNPPAVTTLAINYHHGKEHGIETHEIRYRSRFSLDYAAEWFSFRLVDLIEQRQY